MFLVLYKKYSPNLRPQNFSLLFFPKCFTVLCFRFRPVVNFELLCVYDWVKAKVVFLYVAFQSFQHIYIPVIATHYFPLNYL